jgi:hypothetical protein
VYSTIRPIGGKTALGDLIPGHVLALQQEKWLSLEALTGVDEKSPVYNEKKRAGVFYAESWALVHMLYLSREYKAMFPEFVNALLKGKTFDEAAQAVYGRTAAQVYADLKSYLTRNQLFGVLFPVKLTKSEEEAEVSPVTQFDSELVQADLLATINKPDQAQAAYEKLGKQNPDKPEIPRSLGYMAWQHGNNDAARQYFEKAFAAGEKEAQMCYYLAQLERAANQPEDKIIPPLLRALQSRPDYTDARLELGFVELNAKNFEGALAAFGQLRNLPSDRAAMVFNGMAYAALQLGNLTVARQHALSARKWDRTEAETRQTDDLIRYLDQREAAAKAPARVAVVQPPVETAPGSAGQPTLRRTPLAETDAVAPQRREKTVRVEGTAKALDCSGGTPRFTITVGTKILAFDLKDPDKIILKHNGDGVFDFACGPQKPFPVAIEYAPAENASAQGSAGAIRVIEF